MIQVVRGLEVAVRGVLDACPHEPPPRGAAVWVGVPRDSLESRGGDELGPLLALESVELWDDPISQAEIPGEVLLQLLPILAFCGPSLPAAYHAASPVWGLALSSR